MNLWFIKLNNLSSFWGIFRNSLQALSEVNNVIKAEQFNNFLRLSLLMSCFMSA